MDMFAAIAQINRVDESCEEIKLLDEHEQAYPARAPVNNLVDVVLGRGHRTVRPARLVGARGNSSTRRTALRAPVAKRCWSKICMLRSKHNFASRIISYR